MILTIDEKLKMLEFLNSVDIIETFPEPDNNPTTEEEYIKAMAINRQISGAVLFKKALLTQLRTYEERD